MKKKNESGAHGSASRDGEQPQKVHLDKTPVRLIPAVMPEGDKSLDELCADSARNAKRPIEPGLYLWAGHEMTDKESLCCVCKAISDNECALTNFISTLVGDDLGKDLVIIAMAKGLSARVFVCRDSEPIFFRGLPGQLGKRGVTLREALEHTSTLLWDAESAMRERIGRMEDRGAALELAEALVIAEKVAARCGYDVEDDGSILRLAYATLASAMMEGGAK